MANTKRGASNRCADVARSTRDVARPNIRSEENRVFRCGTPRAANCGISTSRSLADKIALVRRNPSEAARVCQEDIKRAEQTCNMTKYENFAVAYELANTMRNSQRKWEEFKKFPFWSGYRVTMKIEDALRLACMFIYGDRQGGMATIARDHARKLSDTWIGDVDTDHMFAELKTKGFSKYEYDAGVDTAGRVRTAPASSVKRSFFLRMRADRKLSKANAGQMLNLVVKVRKHAGGGSPFLIMRASVIEDGDIEMRPRSRKRRRP